MKPRLNMLKDKYLQHSTIRWAAVGITTTVIDFLIFVSLYGSTNSVFGSNLISAIFATTFNYFMHHRWTFKSGQKHSNSGFKYLINLFFWWLTSSIIIRLLVSAEIDPRFAKLVPLIFIIPINYFVLNKLVFKKKT
jgi:putative flippase GtrA